MKQQSITPTFGALVEGVELARMGSADLRRLYRLWQQRHLLVLRASDAAPATLRAFAAQMGEVEPMEPPGGHTVWGSELAATQRPPFACVLHSTGPGADGDATWFACLPAALRSMAPDISARLRWLALQHGPCVHPMVIMQPETGEASLYLGARPDTRIPGVPQAESDRLLNIIWSYATAASVTLCHFWQPGDIVLWNNLTVAHRHEGLPPLEGLRLKGRYTLAAPIQQEAA